MKRKQGLVVVMLCECDAHKYIEKRKYTERGEQSQEKGEPKLVAL